MKKLYILLLFSFQLLSAQFTQPSPSALLRCDDDADAVVAFDLTVKNQEIMFNYDLANYTFAYFETQAEAQSNTNAINQPTAYLNTSNPQTIYVRITGNQGPNNYGFSSFTLYVYPKPTFYQPPDLTIYQNPYTGTASFDLEKQRRIMSGNVGGVLAQVYLTQSDAMADVNRLTLSCFTNTSPTQTLWGRAYANFEGGCYTVISFTISVSAAPNPNPVVSFPDATFKAKLLQSATTSSIAKDVCNQNVKIDSNNDGEVQIDEAARIRKLNVSNSGIASLEGIVAFSYIEQLNCESNQLHELNLYGMTSLYYLNCSHNALALLDLSQTFVVMVDFTDNDIVYLNIKNGALHSVPPEYPFNAWGNNPLAFVCADESEIDAIAMVLALNGFTTTVLSTDCTLAVAENPVGQSLKIYPNPARDSISIQSDFIMQSITLFDVQGRSLATKDISDTNFVFDLTLYSKGIYLIKVSTGKGTITKKIVKE